MPSPEPPLPQRKASAAGKPPDASATGETKRPADSVPTATGNFTKLPLRFGRYQVEKLLGKGAMGAVYLARDTQLQRPVALKIPKLSASAKGSEKLLKRLKTEALAAAQIDHPSVCPVFDSGDIDGIPFIAMQYVEGETLKDHLKNQAKTPLEAVEIIRQLAEGLAEAHSRKIYHRDLKPENIKLNRRGVPVIMDFGLAKLATTFRADATATQAGTTLGTPAYMSPEQAGGKVEEIDHRSDIYALGVMLYEMLTGTWPFSGSAMQVMGQKSVLEPPSPLSMKPELNSELAAVCHKMIAREQQNRYQTAEEVIAALKALNLTCSPLSGATGALEAAGQGGGPEIPSFETEAASLAAIVARERQPRDTSTASASPAQNLAEVAAGPSASSVASRRSREKACKSPRPAQQKIWIGIGAGMLVVAVIVLSAAGVFKVKTREGILVLEVNEPDAEVFVDGDNVNVTWGKGEKGGRRATVNVAPGERKIKVTKDGFSVVAKKLTFKDGEREILNARLEVEGTSGKTTTDSDEPADGSSSVTQPRVAEKPKAPPDSVPLGNKRFFLFTEHLTWHAARDKCREIGGRLGEVRSAEENDFLAKLAKGTNVEGFWLGATDEVAEGRWLWNDGSLMTYSNWSRAGNQPNNKRGVEHYLLLLTSSGEWCDQPSTSLDTKNVGYVCEWDADAKAAATEPVGGAGTDGPLSFFNGKDLTGWNGLAGYWQVRDGAIVGTPPAGEKRNTFLCSQKKYKEFELRFQVRRKNGVGNSGLQFRSQMVDAQAYRVIGPQIEIASAGFRFPPGSALNEPDANPTYYSAKPVVTRIWNDDDFNEIHIRCIGKHVTVRLSDVIILSEEYRTMPDEGIIAWQLWDKDPPQEIVFKDIQFADLSRGDPPLSAPAPPESAVPASPDSRPTVSKSEKTAEAGEWIDLLEWSEGVDWARGIDWNQNVDGKPTRDGMTLKRAQFMRFPLPAIIDGNYEMELEFTRYAGPDCVAVFFPVGTHNMILDIGGMADRSTQVHFINDNQVQGDLLRRDSPPITINQKQRILIRVEHDAETAAFNIDLNETRDYVKWSGRSSSLTNLDRGGWKITTLRHPWLAAWESKTTFHKVRVRMISGTIRRDVITDLDREQDLKNGFVRLVGEVANATRVGWGKFLVNQIPLAANAGGTERLWPLITRDFRVCQDFYGAHAPSHLKCPIPAKARSFSVVGYNHASRTVKYQVLIDGKQVYDSPVKDIAVIKVEVAAKAKLLELVVDPVGDHFYDMAYWCYPRFHSIIADKITDKMLDGKPGPLNFTVASHTVQFSETLNHNQPSESNAYPIHFRDARPCDEFLFAHAPSSVTYAVPEGVSRFTAIGYNVLNHSVKYEVWADAQRVYESPKAGIIPIDVKLPRGAKTIELKVNDLGNGVNDLSIWCYPRLHRK